MVACKRSKSCPVSHFECFENYFKLHSIPMRHMFVLRKERKLSLVKWKLVGLYVVVPGCSAQVFFEKREEKGNSLFSYRGFGFPGACFCNFLSSFNVDDGSGDIFNSLSLSAIRNLGQNRWREELQYMWSSHSYSDISYMVNFYLVNLCCYVRWRWLQDQFTNEDVFVPFSSIWHLIRSA